MDKKPRKTELEMMRQYCAYFGRIGGKSTSEAKRRAGRENVKKAFAVRMSNLGKAVES